MYIVRAIGSRLQTVVIVGLKEDGNKKNVAGFGLGGIGDSYEVGYLKLIIEACRIVQAFVLILFADGVHIFFGIILATE